MKSPVCRVAIVEDHVLQRARTEELLAREHDFDVVFSGMSAPEFTLWVRSIPLDQRPHLLLLDLMIERQPSVDGALVDMLIKAGLRIVVLSALSSPPLVMTVLRAGVNGVVSKRDPEDHILAASRAVLRGERWMTAELPTVIGSDAQRPHLSIQEERALVLYASGLTVDQVGAEMHISRDTAKQYLNRVKKKYTEGGVPVRSKLDFGRIAWADGYVNPSLQLPQSS